MQRLERSFIKNGKERKDRNVLLKRTDAQPCFWGMALSPRWESHGLHSGKAGKHGVSWNWRQILVVAVHPWLYPTARLGTTFS